jgi:hypothetical protein
LVVVAVVRSRTSLVLAVLDTVVIVLVVDIHVAVPLVHYHLFCVITDLWRSFIDQFVMMFGKNTVILMIMSTQLVHL